MKFLLINTSAFDVISLSLFDETTRDDMRIVAHNRELLQSIDTFFTEHGIANTEIGGVMVVVGEGTFTSTRLAVTVANTFAYVQKIPLLPISKEQTNDPQALLPLLLEQPVGRYISATYSAPPSINMTKK
ncbi:MAG: hypothetical protein COV60_00725 [Candidatus Magasanikbacteria bacterium CG11_big_fil_rev_8_21_14_0_20_43_7]|uniref:Gcp-like domain-containing protein n=1 Tax=Candidatus Magasanikbacteria bacterium CG11_big_fil_rev_8_21_14_0_20_43_7 TaxID=1974654 RepID=A0A2H0N399_9BACT|nr:MAG: hypothetical protein COV60_00725 [Candidatus Magasanikbacteria bacterium CG11_big_fil_rev_8_21_14_0_20_43_7]